MAMSDERPQGWTAQAEAMLADHRRIAADGARRMGLATIDPDELAWLRAVEAAAREWARAREEEQRAIEGSKAADHRGQAWFARCVAGEARQAAEEALYEVARTLDAAPPPPAGDAQAALDALIADGLHFGRLAHERAHGADEPWEACQIGPCPGFRRALNRARGEGAGDAELVG
jgi:hypothetical protein